MNDTRVLVLCHANRYRSPLFAALLQRRAPGIEVRSAGFKEGGRPAAKRIREAASRLFGLDLAAHRSTLVSRPLVEWATHVLVMDGGNERRFAEAFPDQACHRANFGGRVPDPAFINPASPEFADVMRLIDVCTGSWAVALAGS